MFAVLLTEKYSNSINISTISYAFEYHMIIKIDISYTYA